MNHDEDILQAACIQALNYYPMVWAFHPKNEGRKSMQQAMRDKALGLRAGVADLVIMGSNGQTVYIELKTKTGKLNEQQTLFAARCQEWKIHFSVCRSVDEVIKTLQSWGMIPG